MTMSATQAGSTSRPSSPSLTPYNRSPSATDEATPETLQIRFPSVSQQPRPALSPSSSSWSTSTYASSSVRDQPSTPSSLAAKGFRLPRFSLWGRDTPDALPSHNDAVDLATDLHKVKLTHRRAQSNAISVDVQRLFREPESPTPTSASLTPMPALTVVPPTSPRSMSSPKLGSVWRFGGGGGFFAGRRDSSQDRKESSRSGPPSDPVIVPPASQFAAWSELMQGAAQPPERSATFSSISSTSCSGCTRPDMKKVKSHGSIRSSTSAQPLDAEPSTSHRHSLIPTPKAVKTKLRSKNKASQEPDFDKLFLAQELHSPSSSSTFTGSLGRTAQEARSPSLVPSEFVVTSGAEKRSKRSSWATNPSTSPRAAPSRLSADLTRRRSQSGAVRSTDGHDLADQHAAAQRGRIDRQLSSSSYLTTESSISNSSNADETVPPKTPTSTGEPEETRTKRAKATTPKCKTYALQFSLDGRYLAAAGSDHLIRVYEVISSPSERAREIALAQAHLAEEAAQRKACSPAPCCGDRSGTKADVRVGSSELAPVFKSTPVHVFAGHSGDILDLSWSKNNFLLSCSSDKTAKLWHPNREDCLCTFTTSAVIPSIDFHPTDDRFFVTGGLDGKLRLWNITARRVQSLTDVPGVITAVAFSSTGSVVCVGTNSGSVLTFSCTDSLSHVNTLKVKSAAAGKNTQPSKITSIQPVRLDTCAPEVKAYAATISPIPANGDSEYVIVTSNDSRVRIVCIHSQRLVARFKSTSYVNRTSQIRATTSCDTQFLVSGSDDASIHVWSLASNASLFGGLFSGIKKSKSIVKGHSDPGDSSSWRSWQAGTGSVRCAVFAPAETVELLAAAEDPLERVRGEKGTVKARIVVSTDDSNAVRVWRCDPLGRLV